MDNLPLTESIQPSPPVGTSIGPAHRDRSTGLTIFGILQIILGLMAALFIPFILLGAVLARRAPGGTMPLGTYLSSILSYAFLSVLLITLGIGSIRARRWAWALTLVLSWIWLVAGALMTVTVTALLPTSFLAGMRAAQANTGRSTPLPAGVMAVVLTFMIALAAVFLVILPIVFLVFYRNKDVEETCKHRDPVPRWTDRCPLPVLAACILFVFGAAYLLLASVTTPLFPLFGRYIRGLPASLILFPLALLDAFLAYFLYRVRVAAWWMAVTVIVLRLSSAAATFARADLLAAYSRMGWSDRQMQIISASPALRTGVFLWWGLAFSVLFLGYMIWIKRYFARPPATGGLEPQPSSPSPVA